MAKTNQYFSFSKRERTGVIALVTLILIIFLLPEFIPVQEKSIDIEAAAEFQKQVIASKMGNTDSVTRSFPEDDGREFNAPHEVRGENEQGILFHFDPNTISQEGWKRLGIGERTAQTIRKYISKGGRFRKPEDLGKIFGLGKLQYEKLLPFVRIGVEEQEPFPEGSFSPRASNQPFLRKPSIIDINEADTSAFIALPGIGSKLANRIISFREKLGGFHSVNQLKETYGLQDSTFLKIIPFLKCDSSVVQQINLNTADESTFKLHPYFKWNIANAIINYRAQHGDYQSVEDLLNINIITSTTFQRLAPYCRVK
ncbi:MAG: ComEA family DNA-binding protein [Flavisolibacter sp.]